MIATVLACVALILAAVPLALYFLNVRLYRPPADLANVSPARGRPRVSVLIPARDEEASIGAAVRSVLASEGVDLEVVVLDDDSSDGTRAIVEALAERDARVRLFSAPALPTGWCGKQHACWTLSRHASHDILVFLDADVRVEPDGIARAVAFLESSGAELASGVPHQECGSLLEKLLLPLIHFVLLGLLPMGRMRRTTRPAYAAGCGQFFVTRRAAYERAGGHAAIRASLHDGVTLPAAYRRAGLKTDLFDAVPLATCRMFNSGPEAVRGLSRNATEGLAHPKRILPISLLLLGGQVVPAVWLAGALAGVPALADTLPLAALGTLAAYLPRLDACWRYRQPLSGALLHPIGVLLLVAMQWYALGRSLVGQPKSWKGRAYGASPSARESTHA